MIINGGSFPGVGHPVDNYGFTLEPTFTSLGRQKRKTCVITIDRHLGVSWNRATPKSSSFLMGFPIINQPFWGTPILWNLPYLAFGGSHNDQDRVDPTTPKLDMD